MTLTHVRLNRGATALLAFSILTGGATAFAKEADEAPTSEEAAAAATQTPAPTASNTAMQVVEPPAPPPAGVEPIPATVVTSGKGVALEKPAPYIEHLGPDSFPGRSRGLYGGSLWLEPSFHGLQWPYMSHTGVGVSGSFWVDSGKETIKRDQPTLTNSSLLIQQARGVLRVTPTYVRDDLFIQGQIELVGNGCQTNSDVCKTASAFTTDDLWIRVGQWNSWDLKVGRFQGWEVYHLGMGMDPYTVSRLGAGQFLQDSGTSPKLDAPSLYNLNYLYDRPEGVALGNAALHLYLTEQLRVELLGRFGTDNYRSDTSTGDAASVYWGARPTAILDMGVVKFKVGAEYQKRTPITQTIDQGSGQKKDPVDERVNKGFGAAVQFVLDSVEFGANVAMGSQSTTNGMAAEVQEETYSVRSFGGFANLRLADLWILGAGLNYTAKTDDYAGPNGDNDFTSHLQGFLALQYLLAGQLFIKAEAGFARAYFQPADTKSATWNNDMYSGRIRLMYLY